MALLLTAIVIGGPVAMWRVVAVGLFTSIGWFNTFSPALEGVGVYKRQVSSLLVMAILGGAVLPPIMGQTGRRDRQPPDFIPRAACRVRLRRVPRAQRPSRGMQTFRRPGWYRLFSQPPTSGGSARLKALQPGAGLAQEAVEFAATGRFLRRYSEGRHPIHLVKALEKTKGLW